MALTARMVTIDRVDPVEFAKFRTEAAGQVPGPAWTVFTDTAGNEFRVSSHG